jgi:hypothetical protein
VKLLVPLIIVVATLTMPATSWAAEEAGCPANQDLLPIEETLARVDYRIYDTETEAAVRGIIADLDANGNDDGYLCSKQFKPNRGRDKQWGATDYVVTQIGDNKPPGRL